MKKIIILQDFVTGIDELTKTTDLLLYPNPASTELFIKGLDARILSVCTYTIYDITGRILRNQPSLYNGKIDVSGLAKGLYFLEVREDLGRVTVLRFIKE